jgi:competence protein ComEA
MKRTLLLFTAFLIPAAAQDLPAGPGKDVTEKVCSGCHEASIVTGEYKTKAGWAATVDDMAGRGATGTDEEFTAVTNYLARYFGKVNINKATSQEIQDIAGLTAADADAIIAYRTKNGDFADLASVEKVPGIDTKKVEERKDHIGFR